MSQFAYFAARDEDFFCQRGTRSIKNCQMMHDYRTKLSALNNKLRGNDRHAPHDKCGECVQGQTQCLDHTSKEREGDALSQPRKNITDHQRQGC